MMTSFKRSHARTAVVSAPGPAQATTDLCLHQRLLDTHGQVWASFQWSLILSPVSWCTQGPVCALQESVSPVLCKFWWLYGGASGDLLQEGLCHTQVCCTQSPHPWGRPLLTRPSTRRHSDTVLARSLWVGHAFHGLSRSEQLRRPGSWQVHRPRWAVRSNHLLGPSCLVSLVSHESAVSGVPYASSGELISDCDPPGGC